MLKKLEMQESSGMLSDLAGNDTRGAADADMK